MLINAIGTYSASQPLESMAITRRDPGPQDVQIAIAYCGVCHSDLHQARSEWAGTLYPCVPGHEIVGRVTAVGNAVSRYAVGDLVGVGCMVDSCQQCEECAEGLENYCDHMVLTYNGPTQDAPGHTLGGYSQQIVVNERYVLRITHPEAQLAAVAPLPSPDLTQPNFLVEPSDVSRRVKKSAWSASAAWGIWGSSWPMPWGPTWWPLPPPNPSVMRPEHWAPMTWWCRATTTKWRPTSKASTSSSTPWRRRTISMPSPRC